MSPARADGPGLLLALTAHGYGHAVQAAPVANALRARLPGLRLELWAEIDPAVLSSRLLGPFGHRRRAADVGLVMGSPIDVDVDASALAYERLHASWERDLAEDVELLRALRPDVVLCDVPYRPLVAARRAGIPSLALCSLDWADVYLHYCGHLPGARALHEEMVAAYAEADAFVAPQPAMPMPSIRVTHRVGPIARPARSRRAELLRALGASEGEATTVVLVGLGGVAAALDAASWPRRPGTRLLVPAAWTIDAPWLDAFEPLLEAGFHFSELLASSDVYVTKPGYNAFVEAGVLGVPVLHVERADWPEAPALIEWLHGHTRAAEVDREELEDGAFLDRIPELLAQPARPRAEPTGAEEAARVVAALLE